MSASQLSGKEAIKGRAVPSRSEPRHVEEMVGSRGVGRADGPRPEDPSVKEKVTAAN